MTEDTPVDMTLEDLRDEIRCVMLGEQSMPKREGETLSNQALTVLHALEERVPDTVRELVQRCGMTTEVVSRALGQLYRLGRIRIERQAGQMRPVVVQPVGLSTGGRE
ncbi:MAG TPA: helix-turn-helix domain-containing protein [Steroidobacteraceae bacterium]|nr:helix-turn-helix domain-containing protein [Steroidobacteraceae bacterium]